MIVLPGLATHRATLQLPLCEPAAARLLEILLAADENRRCELWRQLLADEPVVALWGLCWAEAESHASVASPRTILALAQRLAQNALPAFAAATFDFPTGSGRNVDPDRCARLSAVAGEAATGVSKGAAPEVRAEAQLLALVHNAPAWFALVGEGAKSNAELIPHWVRTALRTLERDHLGAAGSAERLVSESLGLLNSKRRSAAATQARSALERARRRLERHWRRRVPNIAEQLATVANRSQRLAQLEERFEMELEAAKLESLAEFAAGAGHEMNPPLAVISGRAQLFLRSEEDPERRRELAVINRQAMRVHEMIADMMHFARPARPQMVEFDYSTWLDEVAEGLQSLAVERGVELARREEHASIVGWGDRTQLTVALRAVCFNAIEACEQAEGRVFLELSPAAAPSHAQAILPSSRWATISVCDNGSGLSAEVRRHAFDPYFSGRSAGRGLGLGLSKCWRIVTNHGGHVDLDSEPGQGTICRMWLPLDRPSASD